jgi:acyl dehydratase
VSILNLAQRERSHEPKYLNDVIRGVTANCPDCQLSGLMRAVERHDIELSDIMGSGNHKETYVRFSDLIPGFVIRTPPRLVTAKEMVEFASRYDSQWFHIDPVRASEGRWKGLIASGWYTCSIAMELMVQNVLSGSEAFGSSGSDSIKWLHPVRPEDTVALRFEVLRSSKSPSGRTGILLSKSELWNQSDRLVFTMQGTTLFDVTK